MLSVIQCTHTTSNRMDRYIFIKAISSLLKGVFFHSVYYQTQILNALVLPIILSILVLLNPIGFLAIAVFSITFCRQLYSNNKGFSRPRHLQGKECNTGLVRQA